MNSEDLGRHKYKLKYLIGLPNVAIVRGLFVWYRQLKTALWQGKAHKNAVCSIGPTLLAYVVLLLPAVACRQQADNGSDDGAAITVMRTRIAPEVPHVVYFDSLEILSPGITEHTYMVVADTGNKLSRLNRAMVVIKKRCGIPIEPDNRFEAGNGLIKEAEAVKDSVFMHLSRGFDTSCYSSIEYGEEYGIAARYMVVSGVYYSASSADSLAAIIRKYCAGAFVLTRTNHHM